MPEGYLHLTYEQRCEIYALLQSGHSQAYVARQIGVDRSTISRELVHRAIEKKLKAARLDLSATEALTILKSIRVVDIDLGNGTTKRSVTAGTQRAATLLRAIGITNLDPPTPPAPGQTVM